MVTLGDMQFIQENWAETIVHLGKLTQDKTSFEELRSLAAEKLNKLYDFEGGLIFKPTYRRAPKNFITTLEDSLAYFIGQEDCPGFALKPWQKITFTRQAWSEGDTGIIGGLYQFTDLYEVKTTVEYTMCCRYVTFSSEDLNDKQLKIIAHHSSLSVSDVLANLSF
ncbi:MAG: hypothetical protein OXC40_08120 [Proteobacteria bacterium]|nr:hypothetical protein [Pseudomonadota bacterium]